MQVYGNVDHVGFTYDDLETASKNLQSAYGIEARIEAIPLLGEEQPSAWILIAPNVLPAILKAVNSNLDDLACELSQMPLDEHAVMRGQLKRKRARHNNCIADVGRDADFDARPAKGTIVSFSTLPLVSHMRNVIGDMFGDKALQLFAETNKYYDLATCGIGLHGDGERRLVVGMRCHTGNQDSDRELNTPIQFQWFKHHAPVGERMFFDLKPGDLYAMSEKAVGTDWKRSTIATLRHATGSSIYVKTNAELLKKRKHE